MTNLKKILTTPFLLLWLMINAQEYPIHLTDEGHIIVQVTLIDSISGNFVLDTGAGINILSGKMYEKVKEASPESGFYTGFRHDGDRLDGKLYTIPKISIGTQHQIHSQAGVFPPLDGMGIDGLLSLKFFEDKQFAIDYAANTLIFYSPEDFKRITKDKSKVGIELVKHGDVALDVLLPIVLNTEVQLHALFDTGSGHDARFINPNYLGKLNLKKEDLDSSDYTKMISGQQKKQWFGQLNEIALKCTNLKSIEAMVSFKEDLIYEGLIGSRLFADGMVFFDIANKTLYID